MANVTWSRAKPREEERKPYKLPQEYGSISEHMADRYPLSPRKTLPTRANVGFAKLKRR